ncbi:ABC transporter permease [Pseudonocardia kongjuensis]|uniref:ABC transporter permease n=1 Tax=Pseudonocardia kongjuensis TaxID=102227 RepID=A0ABN1Y6J2_9PSEU
MIDQLRGLLRRNRWWITRTLALPVHVLAFAAAAFFLVRLVPGDPVLARIDTSGGFSQQEYDRMAEAMGLSGSIWSQFVTFMGALLRFDLGNSAVTGRAVWTELMTRLPGTLELIVLGLLASLLATLLLGMIAMTSTSDRVHGAMRFYAKTTGALPDFAVAIVGLVLFYVALRIVPAPVGRVPPGTQQPLVLGFPLVDAVLTGRWDVFAAIAARYVLPLAVIVVVHTSGLWRQLSLGIEEQRADPATLFKVASGATRWSIYRSVLRRACASSIVMLGAKFGALLGGVIVLEQLFGFGGVGQFALDSVDTLDFLGLQGFLVVIAALSLVTFLVVDIVNMLLDPRRRPGVRMEQ